MAKRILLADDSLTIQKVVELTFSDSEYDLVCVPNGQRALDRVQEQQPDLILADVVMPEKNGYEVCEAIKANPATARIPVILLSGTFEPFDRDRAERLGCDAIVSKPFDSQQLLRQVEALLARDPRDVPSASTMAIPTMPAAAPPPPAATAAPSPDRPPAEPGFSSEDFTGSIPRAAEIAGGPDLFEEEYGQADVESAIAAFEKAHPEFSYVEDAAATAALTPGNGQQAAPEEAEGAKETEPDGPRDRGWLRGAPEPEPESAAASIVPPPPPAPAPFWVPRQPEPELAPIPFAGDDSANRRTQPEPEPARADEGPTQQIPPVGRLRGPPARGPSRRRRPGHRRDVDVERGAHGGDSDRAGGRVPGATLRSGRPLRRPRSRGRFRARSRSSPDDVDRPAQGNALVGLAHARGS